MFDPGEDAFAKMLNSPDADLDPILRQLKEDTEGDEWDVEDTSRAKRGRIQGKYR